MIWYLMIVGSSMGQTRIVYKSQMISSRLGGHPIRHTTLECAAAANTLTGYDFLWVVKAGADVLGFGSKPERSDLDSAPPIKSP